MVICFIFLKVAMYEKRTHAYQQGLNTNLSSWKGNWLGPCSPFSSHEKGQLMQQHVSLLSILYTIRDASGPDLSIYIYRIYIFSILQHLFIYCCSMLFPHLVAELWAVLRSRPPNLHRSRAVDKRSPKNGSDDPQKFDSYSARHRTGRWEQTPLARPRTKRRSEKGRGCSGNHHLLWFLWILVVYSNHVLTCLWKPLRVIVI
jgi:hypothetical protein